MQKMRSGMPYFAIDLLQRDVIESHFHCSKEEEEEEEERD